MSQQDPPPPAGAQPGGPAYGPAPRYGSGPGSQLPPGWAPSGPAGPRPLLPYGPAPAPAVGAATWDPVPFAPGTSSGPGAGPGRPDAPGGTPPTRFLAEVALRPDYAPWGRRVAASLLDHAPGYVGLAVLSVGYLQSLVDLSRGGTLDPVRGPFVVGALIMLVALAWTVYNRWFLAGRTGQSVGKRALGLWLVGRTTNRPVGAGGAFLRDLLHYLDGLGPDVGYVWPLWDAERQTFADKVAATVVVTTPVPPLPREHR